MPFMDCVEVWKAECECGTPITFSTGKTAQREEYKCTCGIKYVIDRYSGHYHKIEDCVDVELIESK
jgi:hypothetical protein